ncbi:helix-turn-helix domain-containing protein [Eubacteriales bacterium OttesenSCG-928-N13]|nr:helix-turn-helix domain-containing protein [Eubacteriales bacterium OttesenSCG-928-N13]
MMHRRTLLVVDDEYWIRQHLMTAYDWAQFGVDRILEAGNGEEAKAILESEHVDVLVSDMDMPFMDGLTLILLAQRAHPHVMILVISGYSDFEMVRGAMVGGAVDYLLKPVDKAVLYAAMQKLVIKDEQRREREQKERDLQFVRLVRGETTDRDLRELTGISSSSWRLVVCHFRRVHPASTEERDALRAMMKSIFAADHVFLNPWTRGEALVILQGDAPHAQQACRMAGALEAMPEISWASILISRVVSSDGVLSQTYKQLCQYAYMRPYSEDVVRTFLDGEDNLFSAHPRLPEETEAGLFRAVERSNASAAEAILRGLFTQKRLIDEGWLYHEAISAMRRCANTIDRAAQKISCPPDTIYALHTLQEDMESVFRMHGLMDAFLLLLQMIELIGGTDGKEIPSPIEDLHAWLDAHYTENVTLTGLSEQFHLSPSYLSRCFKKATGTNLVAYLTEKRLAYAQQLLAEGQYSLSEISILAGYDDYSYFSNVFRCHMGCSPSAWQKQSKILK